MTFGSAATMALRPGERSRLYYGWIIVGLGALAMVGTLPGRTQGLGLITEPLLRDLRIDRVLFAQMNLWATLLGSIFCLGIGRAQDQLGSRVVLPLVTLALAAVVLGMSQATTPGMLFLCLVLSRGFGQSALSVVSLTMVGQWFRRRLDLAMAAYSVLLSVGFMVAFPVLGGAVLSRGWRPSWAALGWGLALGLVPLGWLLARRPPDAGDESDSGGVLTQEATPDREYSWTEALRTGAFWVFALASATYNLVASGIGLFNESVLLERGFPPAVYHQSLVVTALTSLVGNFAGGWLASRWRVNRLMSLSMTLLALALLSLPSLRSLGQVYAFAAVMGIAGGFVIVIFFSFWAKTFGRRHLGRIQGTAQMMTVLSSALGPVLLAEGQARTGSYASLFYLLAGVIAVLALAAWRVRLP